MRCLLFPHCNHVCECGVPCVDGPQTRWFTCKYLLCKKFRSRLILHHQFKCLKPQLPVSNAEVTFGQIRRTAIVRWLNFNYRTITVRWYSGIQDHRKGIVGIDEPTMSLRRIAEEGITF
jgi:hypothetical protein